MESIKIVDYDPVYLKIFKKYEKIIKKTLLISRINLIGSMAVPMKGKEEIDILVEVENIEESQELLFKIKFGKGPIVNGTGYLRDYRFNIECEVHLVKFDDPKVKKTLVLVDKLQKNIFLKKQFEEFKLNCDGISRDEYRKKKRDFLKNNGLI